MGDICWGKRSEREGQLVELVGDQNPSPEAPSKSKRGESKGDVRGRATARRAMEKSRYVRVIERSQSQDQGQGKKVGRDDLIEYFLLRGVGSTF